MTARFFRPTTSYTLPGLVRPKRGSETSTVRRLTENPVAAFRPDGSMMDLAAPHPREVSFTTMAANLSKIARFNGMPNGLAYSVAQHSVIGAETILRETGDQLLAALFLLHDGHEYLIGDITTPTQDLILELLEGGHGEAAPFRAAISTIKHEWDMAIYAAAGLPTPDTWTAFQRDAIKFMDDVMLHAEVKALFGEAATKRLGRSPGRKAVIRTAVTPWPAGKAEEKFHEMLRLLPVLVDPSERARPD